VSLVALVDELITSFNTRSMDVPDRLFNRHTQFVLNGTPFEARLGRPIDPLVLMLTRGAAGYRFAAVALQHAVPDAALARGELRATGDGGLTVIGQAWLAGHLRETGDAIETVIDVEIEMSGDTATRVAVTVNDVELARIQEARLR
jgi:hypothetical protein